MNSAGGFRGIVVVGLVLVIVSTATAKYSGGTGEPNDPYQIATAADLIALGETPEDYDKHFILTADIDLDPNLPGGEVFDKAVIAPHGSVAFAGVFDGDGHTISHLTITGGGFLGLFGDLEGGAVMDLGMADVNITGSGAVGGLAGVSGSDVARCYSTGIVSGDGSIGGLVGELYGTATDCYSTCVVRGGWMAGGLAGEKGGAVMNCYSAGAVSGGGGLVGCWTEALFQPGVTSCFWDTEASGQTTSAGGTGLTTIQMHNPEVFIAAGWDFVGETENGTSQIWQIPKGGGYPILAVFSGYTPPQLQGVGTTENPYLISNASELGAIIYYSPHAHYRLAGSIDLAAIRWATPVIPWFSGTFDGNGLTISNLNMLGGDYLGLFGHLGAEAHVRNLGVVDANIVGTGNYIGGLACSNSGDISRCYTTGAVSSKGGWAIHIGGLVANNNGTVTWCYNTAAVSGNAIVGGLVGGNGLWLTPSASVTHCYSTGAVTGALFVGGLVGDNDGSIIQCCSTGVVNGGDSVGGLVGINSEGHVTDCYSTGRVGGNSKVGGLVGFNGNYNYSGDSPLATVTNCYSVGAVSGNSLVGGLMGLNHGNVNVSASFWDTPTSGQATSAGGTGKTTAEMRTASTFLEAGWDFVDEAANGTEDIWWIEEGEDYPRLWWESRPAVRLPVVELDATTFDAAIAEGVVLVDFFATWCSHCTTQAPILEEVADRLEGRAQVAKLDIDKARSIAQRYGVSAVPTLILFQNGVEVKRFLGVTSVDVLVAAILAAVDSE